MKVFISYSHADAKWLKALQTHLAPLQRRGTIDFWDDTKIRPGMEWRKEIEAALDRARVAVLLVSADFLASEFIANHESPRLLASAANQGVKIMSLILRPCSFDTTELAKYQAVNDPNRPLSAMSEHEAETVLASLAKALST